MRVKRRNNLLLRLMVGHPLIQLPQAAFNKIVRAIATYVLIYKQLKEFRKSAHNLYPYLQLKLQGSILGRCFIS